MNVENNKELVPLEYYTEAFKKLDTAEAAARTGFAFDSANGCFNARLLYTDYRVFWPEFRIESDDANAFALKNIAAQIFLLRYLLEGCHSVGSGNFLPYREMPGGDVYLKPFTGRCLTRAAYAFGTRLDAFKATLEKMPVVMIRYGDVAAQAEIVPGYEVRIIVWEGDEEFPPNSQILFSDNFPLSFSTEDRTVVGDMLISDIKRRM